MRKGRTIPARVETVVIYLPDVRSCVPTRLEWDDLNISYSRKLDQVITNPAVAATAAPAAGATTTAAVVVGSKKSSSASSADGAKASSSSVAAGSSGTSAASLGDAAAADGDEAADDEENGAAEPTDDFGDAVHEKAHTFVSLYVYLSLFLKFAKHTHTTKSSSTITLLG